MKTDEFEQRLQQVVPREIPAAWRDEILAAARVAGGHSPETAARSGLFSTLIHQLSTFARPRRAAWAGLAATRATGRVLLTLWRELIWPCRRTWAGLALVWAVILSVQIASGDSEEVVARDTPSLSPQWLMAMRQQNLLQAGLIEQSEAAATVQIKAAPSRPRSQRRGELRMT
jgi:hypothetical protein